MSPMPIITLLTDFGQQDGFVGTMKGVILNICPEATLVDLSHEISPQHISEAAFVLRNAYAYFPTATIHVVVVDPGVGSNRQAILVETSHGTFIGPDNGVFSYIYNEASDVRVTSITNQAYMLADVSRTFHGRDIFSPVAAHLANGVKAEAFGTRWSDFVKGHVSVPFVRGDRIEGHVLHIDRFGNIITDIPEAMFTSITAQKAYSIRLGTCILEQVCESYADVPGGHPMAILSSAGFLEVAVNSGHAARKLGVALGDAVIVEGQGPEF